MNHIIVGCGGVGSWLATVLSKMQKPSTILLVDGDTLELKNLDRQLFSESDIGTNKATALSTKLGTAARPEYFVDGPDWGSHPGATYWCCVDNNRGRREILKCADRVNAMAIIMANETHSAEAYYYDPEWRGTNKDPRVYYPELAEDVGIDPLAATVGCTGVALQANPQLASANFMAASLGLHLWNMYRYFYREITDFDQLTTLIKTSPFKLNSSLSNLEVHRHE